MFAVVWAQVVGMYGDHMDGGWWWVMGIGWLVFLAVVAGVAAVALRQYGSGGGAGSSARQVLDDRFARGEIEENEYRQRRDTLRS